MSAEADSTSLPRCGTFFLSLLSPRRASKGAKSTRKSGTSLLNHKNAFGKKQFEKNKSPVKEGIH
jgi:hypothetical protein